MENYTEHWGTSVKWLTKVKERLHKNSGKSKGAKDAEKVRLAEAIKEIESQAWEDVWSACRFAPKAKQVDCDCQWCVESTGGVRERDRRRRGYRWASSLEQ